MEDAGYELGDDGVWEHPDDGPASLRVGTTGGNQLRELQQRVLQQQLDEAGFEIVIDNVQGADYFRERPFSDEHAACVTSLGEEGTCDLFDITQFAWVGDPWPGFQHIAFRSQGPNNPYGYANDDVDELMDECEDLLDPAERFGVDIDRHRYRSGECFGVRKQLVAGDVLIGPAERRRMPRTRGCQRQEAQVC
jgi:peptide/nickel transport system substrate-binding protein